MAKLSACGRTELVRLARVTESRHATGTERRRSTVALMSDRTTLEKIDVTFPDRYAPKGERTVSRGWKVLGRSVRPEVTPDQFAAHFEARGYTREQP